MLGTRLDREKLQLEQKRLLAEAEKLQIEWLRVKDAQERTGIERDKGAWATKAPIWVAAASIVVTALAAIGSQWYQARKDFQIKAAELVLKAGSANEAKAGAAVLATLFPNYLGADFSEPFRPENFSAFGADIITAKSEFLRLLMNEQLSCETKREGIVLWKLMFKEDTTFGDNPYAESTYKLACQKNAKGLASSESSHSASISANR